MGRVGVPASGSAGLRVEVARAEEARPALADSGQHSGRGEAGCQAGGGPESGPGPLVGAAEAAPRRVAGARAGGGEGRGGPNSEPQRKQDEGRPRREETPLAKAEGRPYHNYATQSCATSRVSSAVPISVASHRSRSSGILNVQPSTPPVPSSLGSRSARFSARREWTSKTKFDRNLQRLGEQAI